MSKAGIGENGVVLGSGDYWSRVNRSTFLGALMRWTSETSYSETLREIGSRAGDMVEEIYDDLQEHKNQLRFINSDRRNALAKQVRGLYDVCRMAGSTCSHSGECVAMLTLSGFFSNPFSDDRAIQAPSTKSKTIRISLPANAWISFRRLRTGTFLSLREAAKKSGHFWRRLRRERAKIFCRRFWTLTRAAVAMRICGENAVIPSAEASIWIAWSELFSVRMSRQ